MKYDWHLVGICTLLRFYAVGYTPKFSHASVLTLNVAYTLRYPASAVYTWQRVLTLQSLSLLFSGVMWLSRWRGLLFQNLFLFLMNIHTLKNLSSAVFKLHVIWFKMKRNFVRNGLWRFFCLSAVSTWRFTIKFWQYYTKIKAIDIDGKY